MYGNFPAKNTVSTPYIPINVRPWPTLQMTDVTMKQLTYTHTHTRSTPRKRLEPFPPSPPACMWQTTDVTMKQLTHTNPQPSRKRAFSPCTQVADDQCYNEIADTHTLNPAQKARAFAAFPPCTHGTIKQCITFNIAETDTHTHTHTHAHTHTHSQTIATIAN